MEYVLFLLDYRMRQHRLVVYGCKPTRLGL